MRQLPTVLLLSTALLALAGCSASRELVTAIAPAHATAAPESPRVSKIVCLWEPGSGSLPNGPKRGVLGQILFFENADDLPVEVDGKLTVYLFDDRGTIEEQTKPVQKLVLSPEELQATHVEASIGHSYHIPVPYLNAEGLAATCTMRVKYTAPNGETVYSDLSSIYLAGKPDKSAGLSNRRVIGPVTESQPAQEAETAKSEVRRIGNTEISDVEAGAERLKSLTIHRELPASRTRSSADRQATRSTKEQPRKRFRLSNSNRTEQPLAPAADDFAPLD